MKIVVLMSGGDFSSVAAKVLHDRGHELLACNYSRDEDLAVFELAHKIGIKSITQGLDFTVIPMLKIPRLVLQVAPFAINSGAEAIAIGAHYSNNSPDASTSSILYLQRLLEYAAPRDKPIKLLTPIYDYSMDTIKEELSKIGR